MGCKQCRAAVEGDGTLVDRMDNAAETQCGCERTKLVDLSPGVVREEEELHFIVSHPGGMLGEKLNPTFLISLDFDGLSVLREGAAEEEFVQTLEELQARWALKARKFHGVATFKTSKTRFDGESRLCCVYDTALEGKPHHGDIAGPALKAGTNSALEKLRRQRLKKLIDSAVVRFEAAADFREGVLSRFGD